MRVLAHDLRAAEIAGDAVSGYRGEVRSGRRGARVKIDKDLS